MSFCIAPKARGLRIVLTAAAAFRSLYHFAEFYELCNLLTTGYAFKSAFALYEFRFRAEVVTVATDTVDDARSLYALREAANKVYR